jgi:hypothetical protein
MSGVVGAEGPDVSMSSVRGADAAVEFPARSVEDVVIGWVPSANGG